MPSGFGELTDQAHDLVSAGDLAGAQRLLADALTGADPRPANATPELAEAASLHARVLVALGEPRSARAWAAFAYAATTRLHGRSDPRTVAAAATLAAVLHRVGSWSRAARLYQEVIIELTASDGPESLRVLAAHADLATVEYARGQCQVARERLQDAWELHREVYGDGHPSGIKMLARLGSMQRDCGQFGEAHDNLALARDLARQHLAPEDPLTGQVVALARAAADANHVCADTPPVAAHGPAVPDARIPPPGDAQPEPDWPQWPEPPRSDDNGITAEQQHPAEGYHPSQGLHPPPEPAHPVPTPRQPLDGPAGPPEDWWAEPATDQPDPAPTDPAATSEPAHPAATFEPADQSTGHPDRLASAAVPPSVVGLTDPVPQSPGVYRLRRVDEPQRSESPSRLLPVPVRRPAPVPHRRSNRLVPIVVAGVVVVLLGAAAVIAGVSRVDGGGGAAAPSSPPSGVPTSDPAATAPAPDAPPASPGAPPTGLSLRDNRDSVALRWTYPAGAEGPVIVSGGRSGQPQNAFADLPAGTDSFVVYGLSRSLDYCFTVAVAWSTDTIARSEEVCTKRR